MLVINDGSSDDTGARARIRENKFPGRIRVIDKPNGGCASARAEGLRQARGEFVGFVDGDDWVELPMFEALYRAATLTGSEIAQCGFKESYPDGSLVIASEAIDRTGDIHAGGYDVVIDPVRLLPLQPTIWRRTYRRDFLLNNDIGFPEHIRRFDDPPFQFETFVCARRVAITPEAYYCYRKERPGQDVGARDERLFVHFELFNSLADRLVNRSNLAIEKQLFRAELRAHVWALGQIEPRLRARYFRAAARHLNRPRRFIKARINSRSAGAIVSRAVCSYFPCSLGVVLSKRGQRRKIGQSVTKVVGQGRARTHPLLTRIL